MVAPCIPTLKIKFRSHYQKQRKKFCTYRTYFFKINTISNKKVLVSENVMNHPVQTWKLKLKALALKLKYLSKKNSKECLLENLPNGGWIFPRWFERGAWPHYTRSSSCSNPQHPRAPAPPPLERKQMGLELGEYRPGEPAFYKRYLKCSSVASSLGVLFLQTGY